MVREISRTKHVAVLRMCKDNQQREFYIKATKKFGWTKDVLIHKIEDQTFEKYLLNQIPEQEISPIVEMTEKGLDDGEGLRGRKRMA